MRYVSTTRLRHAVRLELYRFKFLNCSARTALGTRLSLKTNVLSAVKLPNEFGNFDNLFQVNCFFLLRECACFRLRVNSHTSTHVELCQRGQIANQSRQRRKFVPVQLLFSLRKCACFRFGANSQTHQLTLRYVNAVKLPNESGNVDNLFQCNCSSRFVSALVSDYKPLHTHQLTLSVVNAVKLPNVFGNVDNWLSRNCSCRFVSALAFDSKVIRTHINSR